MNDHDHDNAREGADIDPAVLAELTRALLPFLGPYSITTMKRATRSAESAIEAVYLVAGQIADATKREAFVRHAKRILGNAPPPAAPVASLAHHHNTGGRPASPVTPELMRRGEAALAPIIGPLAGVLVSRYSRAADNSRDFFDRLAGHLRSAEERDTFFRHIRTGGLAAH